MNITSLQIVFGLVLSLSTLLCSIIPVCLYSRIERRNQSNGNRSKSFFCHIYSLINYVTCFGGGIFLGVSLLDLLPEVIHHINMTIKKLFNYDNSSSKHYPVAELLIGFGIFLILFIEQTVLGCRNASMNPDRSKHRKRKIINSSHDEEFSMTFINNDQDPLIETDMLTDHKFSISQQKADTVLRTSPLTTTRNMMLLISLIIHSIFEGVALGSTNDRQTLLELFLAVIIHKSIIGFSLGLKLMKDSKHGLVYTSCCLFSFATFFGILIVISLQQILQNSHSMIVLHDILRAFACGTFFYITFFDILPHELNMSTHHSHSNLTNFNQNRLVKVFCVFIGFSFIGMLTFLVK